MVSRPTTSQPARLADLGDLHVEDARAVLHLGALAVRHREDHGDDPRLEQRRESTGMPERPMIDLTASYSVLDSSVSRRRPSVNMTSGADWAITEAVAFSDQVGNLERDDLRLVESRP